MRNIAVAATVGVEQPAHHTSERPFDHVVETLALAIVSGRLAEGALVPNEAELGPNIVVSRTAYREAVKFLSAKGLIEARPRSGTRVRSRDNWNLLDPDILDWTLRAGATVEFVRELFELRATVEPRAARLAAARRSEVQLEALRQAMHDMETLEPFSPQCVAADIRFHEILFQSSANRALASIKPVVAITILWSLGVKQDTDDGEFRRALRDHWRILRAVEAGDGAIAEAQSVILIEDSLRATELALTQRGAIAAK